ncbi:MAG: hypothetical protein WBZ33_09710 [Thermoactinomyces sp.]
MIPAALRFPASMETGKSAPILKQRRYGQNSLTLKHVARKIAPLLAHLRWAGRTV